MGFRWDAGGGAGGLYVSFVSYRWIGMIVVWKRAIVLLEEYSSYSTWLKKEKRKEWFEDLRQDVDTEVFWRFIVQL